MLFTSMQKAWSLQEIMTINIPQKFRFLKINTSLEAKIFQGSVQYR